MQSEPNSERDPRPVINQLECKGCGRCIADCPKSALVLSREFNQRGYRYVEYKGEACSGCGSCFYTCPEPGAISVRVPPRPAPGSETQDTTD
jgi:2-oxoisovalerate ferredoxin oxidoreductase delta subunit